MLVATPTHFLFRRRTFFFASPSRRRVGCDTNKSLDGKKNVVRVTIFLIYKKINNISYGDWLDLHDFGGYNNLSFIMVYKMFLFYTKRKMKRKSLDR